LGQFYQRAVSLDGYDRKAHRPGLSRVPGNTVLPRMMPIAFKTFAGVLLEERVEIAFAMQNVHDFDALFAQPVENHILSDWETAIAAAQFFAAPSEVRISPQLPKMCRQPTNEAVCGIVIIVGDIVPDLQQIAARLFCDAVGHLATVERGKARASCFNSSAS